MKSLFFKEARETLIVALPLIALITIVLLATVEIETLLVAPDVGVLLEVIRWSGIAAIALACVQFVKERRAGTLGLLVHRGTGSRGAYLAKLVSGSAVAWLVATAPLAIYAVVQSFGVNERIVHWSRVGECALAACAAPMVYAVAAWCLALRRGWRGWVLVIVLPACVWELAPSAMFDAQFRGMPFVAAWLGLIAFALLVFGWLGMRAFTQHFDRELAPSKLDLAVGVLVCPWLCAVELSSEAAGLQEVLALKVSAAIPALVLDHESGEILAAKQREQLWYALDAEGRIDPARPLEDFVERPAFVNRPAELPGGKPPERWSTLSGTYERLGPWFARATRKYGLIGDELRAFFWTQLDSQHLAYTSSHGSGSLLRQTYLDRSAGVVRVIGTVVEPRILAD